MKKLVVIIFTVIFVFCLSSCQSCSQSGQLVERRKMQKEKAARDSIASANEREQGLRESFIISGSIYADSTPDFEGGIIDYGININSDNQVNFILVMRSAVKKSTKALVPLVFAMKARDVIKNQMNLNKIGFFTYDRNVYICFHNAADNQYFLDQAMKLIKGIERETKWKISVDSWKAK